MRLYFVLFLIALLSSAAHAQDEEPILLTVNRPAPVSGTVSAGASSFGRLLRLSAELAANPYISVVVRVADTRLSATEERSASRGQEFTIGATYRLLDTGRVHLSAGPGVGLGSRTVNNPPPVGPQPTPGGQERGSSAGAVVLLEAGAAVRLLPIVRVVGHVGHSFASGPSAETRVSLPALAHTTASVGIRIGR